MSSVLPWRKLRAALAADGSRARAVQFLASTTSYYPLPHQMRAHLACPEDPRDTAFKLFLGGVGAGKTMWGAAEDVLLALVNPGVDGFVMAPTFDQVLHNTLPEFRRLTDEMAAAGYPLVRKWIKSRMLAELVCGGRVLFRSFDKVDSSRGFNLGWAHLDESEQVSKPGYVFDVISGRLRDQSAFARQMHITTTPRGRFGVVKKFLEMQKAARALKDEDERRRMRRQWWVGRAPTTANVHLPKGYVESLQTGYSKRQWEQEVEAQVLKPEAAIYGEFSRGRHVIPYAYDPALPYDLACDWGDHRPHYLWIQRWPNGQAVIFDEFCADDWPVDKKNRLLIDKCNALGKPPEHLAMDKARKDRCSWAMGAFPSTWPHKMKRREDLSVRNGIEVVRVLLDPMDAKEPRLFFAQSLEEQGGERSIIRCMEGYKRRQHADGSVSDQPWKDGRMDNGPDALRYWAMAVGGEDVRSFVVGRYGYRKDERYK